MILEGTDGRVHFIRHTSSMEKLRAAGHLKPNHFVSFERAEGKLAIEDHGNAHAYLSSDRLRQNSKRLIPRGVIPTEIVHCGWLGAYHRALVNPAIVPEPNRAALPGREKTPGKGHGR